jgi:hypothetical protein
MKLKFISLTKVSGGKFDLAMKVDGSIKKMPVAVIERDGVLTIEGSEFEKQLWTSGSAKANQKLITEINRQFLRLRTASELLAA